MNKKNRKHKCETMNVICNNGFPRFKIFKVKNNKLLLETYHVL